MSPCSEPSIAPTQPSVPQHVLENRVSILITRARNQASLSPVECTAAQHTVCAPAEPYATRRTTLDDGNSKPLLVGECCSQNVLRRCTTRTEIKAHAPPSLESVFCKHVYSNGQRRAHALQRGLGVVSGWSRCGNPCPPQHPILDSQGAPLQALHGSQQLVPAGRSNGEDQQ